MHVNCFWVSKWYYDNCEKITDPRTGKRMYHTQSGFRVEKTIIMKERCKNNHKFPCYAVLTDDSDNNTFVESKVSSINVPPLPNETYDVLSHDWGKFEDDDGTMIQNHDRVKG